MSQSSKYSDESIRILSTPQSKMNWKSELSIISNTLHSRELHQVNILKNDDYTHLVII